MSETIYLVLHHEYESDWAERAFRSMTDAQAHAERIEPCDDDHPHQRRVGEHTEWRDEFPVDGIRFLRVGQEILRQDMDTGKFQYPWVISDFEATDAEHCDRAYGHAKCCYVVEVELS